MVEGFRRGGLDPWGTVSGSVLPPVGEHWDIPTQDQADLLSAELLARYGIPEPAPPDTPITAGARLIEYDPDAVEKPAPGREVRVPRSEREVFLGHWGRRTGRHVEKMGLDLVPGRKLD